MLHQVTIKALTTDGKTIAHEFITYSLMTAFLIFQTMRDVKNSQLKQITMCRTPAEADNG
jgi:hypothetical protein